MPRPVTTRSAKSVQGWVFKSDQLAQAFAPIAFDAVDAVDAGKSSRGASDRGTRIAVAANLHVVMGLQAFAQPSQATTDPEVDDALLLPFI